MPRYPIGGKAPKRKGDAGEREFAKLMGGERTYWQPGNTDEEKKGDLFNVPHLGRGEVKRRKSFKTLYNWLGDNDFLALREDSQRFKKKPPWLVVMRAQDLKLIIDEIDELKRGALK
jgi:hypothetical protein